MFVLSLFCVFTKTYYRALCIDTLFFFSKKIYDEEEYYYYILLLYQVEYIIIYTVVSSKYQVGRYSNKKILLVYSLLYTNVLSVITYILMHYAASSF